MVLVDSSGVELLLLLLLELELLLLELLLVVVGHAPGWLAATVVEAHGGWSVVSHGTDPVGSSVQSAGRWSADAEPTTTSVVATSAVRMVAMKRTRRCMPPPTHEEAVSGYLVGAGESNQT